MAWYPNARKREIRPGSNDPRIRVVGAILHVDAGNAESLFDYFDGPSGGIESHFHIRRDGTVEQYRNTGYEADANFKANSFLDDGVRKGYVSIETQGLEDGEWTGRQIRAIKDLLTWLADTHGFPLRECRDARDPGVGYHTLFGAPGPWTPVAKSCPGPDRKRQFRDVLVPWFKAATEPKPKPDPKPTGATYVVKAGDSLSAIAEARKTTVAALVKANDIADPDVIQVGQRLVIPGASAPRPKPAVEPVRLDRVVAAAKRDPEARAGTFTGKRHVEVVEDALVREGLLARKYADGHFGTATVAAYAAYQRRLGYRGDDADGIPGADSLSKLGKKYGFAVDVKTK